jgi:hypothetical protein
MSTTPNNSRFRNLLNRKLIDRRPNNNNNNNNNNGGVPEKVKLLNVWKKAKNNATRKRFRRQLSKFNGDPYSIKKQIDKVNVDLRIFQVEDPNHSYNDLSVLRSILIDIESGKFKVDPKTGLPNLRERVNMSTPTNIVIDKRLRLYKGYQDILSYAVVPVPVGMMVLVDPTGIAAGVLFSFFVLMYVSVYIEDKRHDKHILTEIEVMLTTNELIEKIDKILQGQPIETVENPLFDAQRAELARVPFINERTENEVRRNEMAAEEDRRLTKELMNKMPAKEDRRLTKELMNKMAAEEDRRLTKELMNRKTQGGRKTRRSTRKHRRS